MRHPYIERVYRLSDNWQQSCVHFSEKEGVCGKAPDYAHEKLGFLTWHRLFLLWFEREIKIELDKPDFRLYYWDWRGGKDIDKLLTRDRFGGIGPNNEVLKAILGIGTQYVGKTLQRCVTVIQM